MEAYTLQEVVRLVDVAIEAIVDCMNEDQRKNILSLSVGISHKENERSALNLVQNKIRSKIKLHRRSSK